MTRALEGSCHGHDTAAVRSHGGALPLFSGAIAMDGLHLDHIRVEPQIAAGRLDAALSDMASIGRSGAPTADWEIAAAQAVAAPTAAQLVPLVPHARALEAEWYQRTKMFPMHDLIVIKNAVLAEHPWVAPELLRAFQASKALHLQRLADAGPSTADDRHMLETQEMIGGGDPLPFGLAANRPTLAALIQYAYSQRIIPVKVRPEEVFAPHALDL